MSVPLIDLLRPETLTTSIMHKVGNQVMRFTQLWLKMEANANIFEQQPTPPIPLGRCGEFWPLTFSVCYGVVWWNLGTLANRRFHHEPAVEPAGRRAAIQNVGIREERLD